KTVLSYNKKVIKELLDFGKYSMGTNLSATLFQTVENFVINFMLGPAALAICDVGAKMLEFVEIPLRSFSVSGMPILAAAHNKGDKDKVIKTAKQLIGIFTVLMIPCVIIAIIFAEPIIGLIGGGKYINTEAVNLFRLFITISLLYPADRFLSLTLDAVNMPKVNFIKALIMLAVLTVSCFLGVYLTGNIYGIAYASVFPLITSIYISYLYINSYQIFSFSGTYKFGYHDLKYRFNELLRLKNNASENDI
ncbi:MAG: lipopolysaccharide biosynthesis protein, partial [Pelobium sp.]